LGLFPNQLKTEGQPMLRAYERLQVLNGVFPNINPRYLDMTARTDVLPHFSVCAAVLLHRSYEIDGMFPFD